MPAFLQRENIVMGKNTIPEGNSDEKGEISSSFLVLFSGHKVAVTFLNGRLYFHN